MDTSATLDLINEAEVLAPVASWRVGSVPVWPFVRERIVWSANADNAPQRARTYSDSPAKRYSRRLSALGEELPRFARASVTDRCKTATTRSATDLLILADNVSRVLLDGVWYDRLCDPLVDVASELGLHTLQLDPHHLYRTPRARPSRWIQPRLDALLLAGRATRSRAPEPELAGVEAIRLLLNQRGVTPASIASDGIRAAARQIRLIADDFGRLIDRTRPVAGALVDFSVVSMSFNLACREAGIPSVELQHGVQGAGHWAYARWEAVPKDGYSVLPAVYWCWGDSEARAINAWAHRTAGAHRAVVGGNLWVRSWLERSSPSFAAFENRARAALPGDGPYILWTLQPGVSGPEQLDLLVRAAHDAPPAWVWLPRLHPAMTAAERTAVQTALARLDSPAAARAATDGLPLPALLRHVGAHVTFSSSATLEAAAFGVPTVLTSPEGELHFADAVSRGRARAAAPGRTPSAPELLAALAEAMATRPHPVAATPEDASAVLRAIVGSGSRSG